MKRFFRKVFSKLIFLLFICAIAALGYYYRDYIKQFAMRVKGTYYIYRGDQAYSQDNMAKTLEFYKEGLRLFPEHYDAWFNLGNIYAVYEDYFSAVDAYKQAIEHNSKFVLARMNLGIVYLEDLGFFDEAIEQFDIVTQTKLRIFWLPFVYKNNKSVPTNIGLAYYNKGVAYKQKAMYLPVEKRYLVYSYLGEAVEAYKKALKYIKKNYDIYYNKAVAHHLRGEYKEAGLDYCQAIKLQPMKFEAHYNLAVLLRQLKRNSDSINELKKAAILILEEPDSSNLETTYIFNLLNEVTRRFITSDEYYTEKLTDDPIGTAGYTYVHGKIVPDEEFDKVILKNFTSCAGYDYFIEKDPDEEAGGIFDWMYIK